MTEVPNKGVVPPDCTLTNDIIKLYISASVQNINEAITVLFHSFLLESGFTPKDVSDKDKYQYMPGDWNANAIFKIKYTHHCCPSFTCCMTSVPLYNTVSVHGIICDVDCSESIDFKTNVNKYFKQKKNFSNALEVFCNLEELSRCFKDNFCLPLLNLLHDTIGRPLYGLQGLFYDLKINILQYLSAEDVTSMSAVNKDFNAVANSNHLWKYLFEKTFSRGGVPDIDASSEVNWKQLYKREYLKKKRKPEPRTYRFPHYRMPQLFSVGPDYDVNPYDIGIYFDPPPPSNLFPPFIPPGHPFFRRAYNNM